MKPRFIILTIDTITELLKDYVGGDDIPADAMPIKLMLKSTEQGKLAIEMVSDTWRDNMDPLMINFKIKRVYGV